MAPTFPFTALPNAEVFSVDDRSAQLVWRSLGTGGATAHVAGRSIPLGPADRVGAAIVDELTPGSPHVIDITVDGRPAARLTATTSPSLSSAPLSRIATISDLHFGEEGFGLVKRMSEPRSTPIGHPLRCALAAVREAEAWGAQLLVVKGDITDRGHGHEWEQFDTLLSAIHVPVIAIPGNHDVKRGRRSVDATEALRARGLFPCPVHHVDVPGARIVAVDTTIRGQSRGRLEPRLVDLQAALDADRPMLVFLHHHLEVTPLPVFWPIGVPRSQGMAALERMLEVNADILVSSGHTHRIRARSHGTAVVTEVGSTKDHPGVWAGYEIHAEGVHQTVRRVAEPACLEWTERTAAVVGGIWGRWAPGELGDRSVTHRWTGDRRAAPPTADATPPRACRTAR